METIEIRRYQDGDWSEVWDIIRPVIRAGDTYALPRDMSESDAREYWIQRPFACYVSYDPDDDNRITGTYFLKPNQAGPGSHVCNCGYIVSSSARGQGIASGMCRHSQREARSLGFLFMQYNLVVSTNTDAVRLWEKLGFDIAGTLPGAFRHPEQGLVDAYVMYKKL